MATTTNLDHRLLTAAVGFSCPWTGWWSTLCHRHCAPALRQWAAVDLSLAERHDVTPLACVYEAKGLLAEPERTAAGYRLYTANDIAEILTIHRRGTSPCAVVRDLIDTRLALGSSGVGQGVRKAVVRRVQVLTSSTDVAMWSVESGISGVVVRWTPDVVGRCPR